MKLLKRLLCCPGHSPISDEEVLYRTGMPSPTTMLRLRRLRYLGSLFEVGDTACWGLLNQDYEWLSLVKDDFRWLWHQLHIAATLGIPQPICRDGFEVIQFHRGYWKRLLRRAAEHSIGVQTREFFVATAHLRFLEHLCQGGFIHPDKQESLKTECIPKPTAA